MCVYININTLLHINIYIHVIHIIYINNSPVQLQGFKHIYIIIYILYHLVVFKSLVVSFNKLLTTVFVSWHPEWEPIHVYSPVAMAWFVSNFLVNTGSGQSVATNCWIYMNAHMLVYSVQYICAANEPGKTKGAL